MRYLHISARLTTIMGQNNTPQTVVVRPGTTFNVGRNAEKRAARAEDKSTRATLIDVRRRTLSLDARLCARLGGEPATLAYIPKLHASKKVVAMLSDRRLRQRGGESDPRILQHAA